MPEVTISRTSDTGESRKTKISTLLNAAKASHPVIERCDICDLIERTVTHLKSRATARIGVHCPHVVPVPRKSAQSIATASGSAASGALFAVPISHTSGIIASVRIISSLKSLR